MMAHKIKFLTFSVMLFSLFFTANLFAWDLENDSPTIVGTWDAGGAAFEIPNSTSLPGTCTVGEQYMDTDATTGQRYYLCETTDNWVLQGDGAGSGSAVVLDIGDDGGDDSADMDELATTGDDNQIFTEITEDKLLIRVGNNWPTSDTADALSANGGNCGAGEYPLGVDAAGAVESCTDATTEINTGLATQDECSEITSCMISGTLTDERICEYESTGTIIDCTLVKDGSGECASGAVCLGDHTHALDDVTDPDASKTFGMGTNSLKFQFANTTAAEAFELEALGNFSKDLMHIHQHTGNPTAGSILVVEWEDMDVGSGGGVIIQNNSPGAGSGPDQVGLLITTDDNDDADYVPLLIQDDSGGTPDDLFKVGSGGEVEAGIWNGTAIAAGYYAAGSIDGDDVNANIAGRSLTLTGASPDTLDIDAELYTDQTGYKDLDPTVGSLDNMFSFMNAITITYVSCITDAGTVTLNLEDGSANDILSSDIVCDAGGQTACAAGCDVDTIETDYDNITAKTEWVDVDTSAESGAADFTLYVGYIIDD